MAGPYRRDNQCYMASDVPGTAKTFMYNIFMPILPNRSEYISEYHSLCLNICLNSQVSTVNHSPDIATSTTLNKQNK